MLETFVLTVCLGCLISAYLYFKRQFDTIKSLELNKELEAQNAKAEVIKANIAVNKAKLTVVPDLQAAEVEAFWNKK